MTRRRIYWGVVVVIVVLTLTFGWMAARSAIALSKARDVAAILTADIARGDVEAAKADAELLDEYTSLAVSNTSGPLWVLPKHLPFFGDDVRALATVAHEADAVVDGALPVVLDVSDQIAVDRFSPRKGKIDIAALADVAPQLREIDAVVGPSADRVAALDTDGLPGRLRVPVESVQEAFAQVAEASDAARRAADLLPTMLGGDGKRRYLLIIQNNAEARSTGGIPGSYAELIAKNGKISMGRQGSNAGLGTADKPVLELTRDERSIFPTSIATEALDTVIDPDFPRAASLVGHILAKDWDTEFDGVVSVDPVALAQVLRATGPVELENGIVLTADNAVDVLLNRIYEAYGQSEQNDVFEDAARKVFDTFIRGDYDSANVLRALVESVHDNRILLWAVDDEEQASILKTGISGAMLPDTDHPTVGVFLNDALGGKMQYFLQADEVLRSESCTDGRQRLSVRARLQSTAGPEIADASKWVVGLKHDHVKAGTQVVSVRIYGPTDGRALSLEVDGRRHVVQGGTHLDRRVVTWPVTLEPGGVTSITATFESGPGQTGDPVLRSTPTVEFGRNDVRSHSSCD